MMRPMKLAGSELMFGEGSLAYIKTIKAKKVSIVIGGHSMEKSGMLAKVEGYFKETGAETMVIRGVEPDPSFETVLRGRNEMLEFEPDLIVGLGGGSAMDAAKAMWIFYEHPELTQMEDILPPNEFPKLRGKARMCCIPSTSGTASEVSRSIVISDNEKGLKHGVGNMEMMPDIAICDPEVTMSMPAKITAETGMDALTHALEALASNRANYLSDILASQAAQDIMETLPTAYENGNDIKARETMVQASMVAGIAFTNVSLGIVHSMAHTIGGIFHVSHGLADAIILPYIIRYNEQNETAKEVYAKFAKRIGAENLHEAVEALNEKLNIPKCFKEIIPDEEKYMEKLDFTILTSISEGQPLSVLESLAARRPCVTTDVGCCRELLEGKEGDFFGPAGYCVPPMYREGLAAAMERMCESRSLRLRMGKNGQARVKAYYRQERMLQKYRELYREVDG